MRKSVVLPTERSGYRYRVDTSNAIAHRVRQARTAALRAQLALTLTQILLWLSLIAGVITVAVWLRRRILASLSSTEPDVTADATDAADRI